MPTTTHPGSEAASASASASASSDASYATEVSPALQHFEGKFENARGQSLFYWALFAKGKHELRGVVLFLHGTGDHCRRYLALFEWLCEEGFGVIAYDFVNHGASDCDSHGVRGHVHNFRHLVEDTNLFVLFAKNTLFPQVEALHQPPTSRRPTVPALPPLIVTGHSFGTLVGMHVVLSGRHKFHAAFWGSAMVGVEMTAAWKLQAAVIQPLSLLVPKARVVSSIDYHKLWRDPAYLEDFNADTLVDKSDLTARTGQQMLRAMDRLLRNPSIEQAGSGFCALHMLFLAGSEDHVADQGITKQFFNRLANGDKEFKVFPGVFHAIFQDPESDDVVAYVIRWLLERCPRPFTDCQTSRGRH